MRILRGFLSVVLILLAAALGGWVGAYVRALALGEPEPEFSIRHKNAEGEDVIGLRVTLVHFLPGLGAALLNRPRWLYAFLGSLLSGAFLSSRYDDRLLALLESLQAQLPQAAEREAG